MTVGVPLPDALPASLADRPVFRSNGTVFTVADLARRAGVGDREVLFGSAAPGQVEPHQVEEAFRRARGLLRADQLEAWLATWSVPADDFRRWTVDVATGSRESSTWCALLCSGVFDNLLASYVAAAAAACELGEPPTDPVSFDADGWVERLVVARTDQAALAAAVAAHRLDWTHLVATQVVTDRRGTAEELRHQVLADGAELAAAAAHADQPVASIDGPLASITPTEVRTALAGARPGETVGPVATAETWALVTVHERREPALDDPATLARAAATVRNDVIARAVARHVVA